ncbi:MAG: two-component system response regulator [Hyalangium sp.]|uniref:response regulator n=1 Tax=Hyalangium sp. TaxID=2028555 RepID=UPI00389A6A90
MPPPRQRDGRHPRRGQRARPGQRVLDPAARGPGAGGRARFQDEALPPGAGSARARRRGGRGQGLAQAAEHDAILCDLMMPEMSGAQFHHELERLAPEQAERVIFMTGGAFTEETRAFLSTARNPCMDKPIDIQRLFSMLEALPAAGSLQGTHEPSA